MLDEYRNIGLLNINVVSSTVSKKDKGAPDPGTERPDRVEHPRPDPDRSPRPERTFELPGEVIVPDRDSAGNERRTK
jgi:hypothetical protein